MANRAMSDSNVQWMGDIPNNWSVEPIGKLFTERNTKVSDLDFPPLSVTKKGIVPQLENAAKSKNHNDRKQVNSGDFVINSRSDRKMSSGLSSLDGSVSLINIVLTSKSVFPGYTKYLLKNYGFAEEFYRWGTGIVADLWSTRYERMKRILVPYPSYEEQQKIVAFLDEKVSHIENIIEDTKKSIENLKSYKQSLITETVTKGLNPNVKMKNSNSVSEGKIPYHWKVAKIGNVTKLQTGTTPTTKKRELFTGNYNWYTPSDLNNFKLKESTRKLNSMAPEQGFVPTYPAHSVLVVGIGATIGKVGYVDHECSSNQQITALIPNEKIKGKFLAYYMLVNTEIIKNTAQYTTLPIINNNDLRKISLIVPPIEEQIEIVKYIDNKTSQINRLINNKEQLINELESYKKSLIYEYVTGKKEVK